MDGDRVAKRRYTTRQMERRFWLNRPTLIPRFQPTAGRRPL